MVNVSGNNQRIPVTIRGVTYPSMSAAARALDVHLTTIRGAIDIGRLDTVGLYRTHGNPSRASRRSKANLILEGKIIEMTAKGKLPREIAQTLQISVRTIYYWTNKARNNGVLPPADSVTPVRRKDSGFKTMTRIAQRKRVRMGSYRQVVASLPTGIMHWLADQVPEGGSVAELISSIITDTYHEENDK